MKVRIKTGEWYPVYGEGILTGVEVEIPGDLWSRYLDARERFSDLLQEVDECVSRQLK